METYNLSQMASCEEEFRKILVAYKNTIWHQAKDPRSGKHYFFEPSQRTPSNAHPLRHKTYLELLQSNHLNAAGVRMIYKWITRGKDPGKLTKKELSDAASHLLREFIARTFPDFVCLLSFAFVFEMNKPHTKKLK